MTIEGEAAVGGIARWAAWLEFTLVDLCAELINDNNLKVGNIVTANMSAASLIQRARKLTSDSATLSPEVRKRILAALVDAKTASEKRNRIVHAYG